LTNSLRIGVDLGGTKLAAGLVDDQGNVLHAVRWSERISDYGAAVDAIAKLTSQLRERARRWNRAVDGVGVAVAAHLDRDRTAVLHAPYLDWRDHPLRTDLQTVIDLEVVLANDGDAAAWGEYLYGAGAGSRNLIVVTVGTGVGAGLVVDDRLVQGTHGLAGEIGHVCVVPDGAPCVCGGRGCLEQYASGTALTREARRMARERPEDAAGLLDQVSQDAAAIQGRHVLAAAERGDVVALQAFEEVGRWLGYALAQVATVFDPDTILLSGGLAGAREIILAPTRTSFERHVGLPAVRAIPSIGLGAFWDHAAVPGAAALAASAIASRRPGR
jgi:glucokinase